MPERERLRRRLRKLHAANPRCRWCGDVTEIIDGFVRFQQDYPKRATIDHLDDRFSPLRGRNCQPGMVRTVLACWECNQRRCRERLDEMIDLQRHKSRNGHRKGKTDAEPDLPLPATSE